MQKNIMMQPLFDKQPQRFLNSVSMKSQNIPGVCCLTQMQCKPFAF